MRYDVYVARKAVLCFQHLFHSLKQSISSCDGITVKWRTGNRFCCKSKWLWEWWYSYTIYGCIVYHVHVFIFIVFPLNSQFKMKKMPLLLKINSSSRKIIFQRTKPIYLHFKLWIPLLLPNIHSIYSTFIWEDITAISCLYFIQKRNN